MYGTEVTRDITACRRVKKVHWKKDKTESSHRSIQTKALLKMSVPNMSALK